MEAQVWTLIGLFAATVVGLLLNLSSRLDGLGARLDAVFARFDRIDAKFERIEAQGEALAQQFYGVATALDDHLRRHAG